MTCQNLVILGIHYTSSFLKDSLPNRDIWSEDFFTNTGAKDVQRSEMKSIDAQSL